MNKQETIADIIAEMLGARTEFPFVYLMGEPDTPEVIDFTTQEIIEPRKINIRRVTVKELASRLKAALKRESGDRAKMREALIRVLSWLKRMNKEPLDTLAVSVLTPSYAVNRTAKSIIEDNNYHISQLTATLAAPPRNCDVGTAEEQEKRFDGFCYVHLSPEKGCGNCPLNGKPCCELSWAQMPYEEGGANE